MSSQILSYNKKSKILKSKILKQLELVSERIQESKKIQGLDQVVKSENLFIDGCSIFDEDTSIFASCQKKVLVEDNQIQVNNTDKDTNILEEDTKKAEDTKKHELNNSFFPQTFDLEKLVLEVESISSTKNKPLAYYSYSLKNLISVNNQKITGGSKALEHYVSPFNATIYNSLKNAGAINFFNSNLDEFGMSGTGLDSAYGHVSNPYDKNHMIGGSSSGSAYVVSEDMVDFAIGSDTGDSGRIPASNAHVFGFKPSYGIVSRFGFFPFCSQFDTPAIFSKDLEIIAEVLSVISHEDPKDLNTINTKPENYETYVNKDFERKIKIVVFNETFDLHPNNNDDVKNTQKEFLKMVEILKKDDNFEISEISFEPELLKLFVLIYIVVSYSESISNYSNINGLLFPFDKKPTTPKTEEPVNNPDKTNMFEDPNDKIKPSLLAESSNFEKLLLNARKNFGKEFKFRQLLGMHFLDGKNYDEVYLQSKKLLTVINQKIKTLFEEYDAILSPTAACSAGKISSHQKKYDPSNIQNIILIANFCGLPAISMPWIFDKKLPVGLHLSCGYKKDGLLLQITSHIAKHIKQNFPDTTSD